MSQQKKGKRAREKDMTRGEFLALGATAAAGSVGGVRGLDPIAAASRVSLLNQACKGTCPPEPVWAVPAGVLNALWSDVLPRVIADAWRDGDGIIAASAGNLFAYLNAHPFGLPPVEAFLERMRRFAYPSTGGTLPLSSSDEPIFSKVDAYFSDPQGRIPVRWVGEGGFDFLLSDDGLDVFVPKKPETPRELLRYYTFRRTGRKPIGTPLYLQHPILATSTDSPTGPGQIRLDPNIVVQIIEESLGDQIPADCGALIECVRGAFINDSFEHRGDERPTSSRDREKFRCVMAGFRCWQMEGAVYRGIMTEFPRVVAEAWLEEEEATPPNYPTFLGSYRERLDGPNARTIFEDRIETMIDGSDSMDFESYAPERFSDPVDPFPPLGSPWRNHWPDPAAPGIQNAPDIMVTNRGFYFPKVPLLQDAMPGSEQDRLDKILEEIRDGRAGNPVFTDSMRTNRGG